MSNRRFALTYEQKIKILDYLSKPERWQNHDPMGWLTAFGRSWKGRYSSNIFYYSNPAHTWEFVKGPAPAGIEIKHRKDLTIISDEQGARVAVQGAEIKEIKGACVKTDFRTAGLSLRPPYKPNTVRFDRDGTIVHFDEAARKVVHLENTGATFVFDKSDKTPANRELQSGKFFHSIPLGFRVSEPHIATKLVVAYDLNIQPDLVSNMPTQQYWDADIDEAVAFEESSWQDTTDFADGHIAAPKNFAVQYVRNQFRLWTTSDIKNQIINYGHIFRTAVKRCNPELVAAQYLQPGSLHNRMSKAAAIEDHEGRKWRCSVVQSGSSAVFTQALRTLLTEEFSMYSEQFLVMNYNPNRTFIAADHAAFEAGYERYCRNSGIKSPGLLFPNLQPSILPQ